MLHTLFFSRNLTSLATPRRGGLFTSLQRVLHRVPAYHQPGKFGVILFQPLCALSHITRRISPLEFLAPTFVTPLNVHMHHCMCLKKHPTTITQRRCMWSRL